MSGTTVQASAELQSRLQRVVSSDPAHKFAAPGAVFGIMAADGTVVLEALGVDAIGLEVACGTFMPIASASKLATGLLILRLVEDGYLDLDSEIGVYLPDAEAAKTAGVTLKRMLSHTSGLPIDIRHELSDPPGSFTFKEGTQWPNELAEASLREGPRQPPGTGVQYSNVAFGLLGLVAEQVTARPFADAIDELVFQPLSIQAFVGRMPPGPIMCVTDVPSPYAGTPLEPYNSPTARLGGTPFAGVLTNAAGLLQLVRSYASSSRLLSEEMARLARTDHTGGMAGGFVSDEAFPAHFPPKPVSWSPCPWGLSIELQGGKQPHWVPAKMPDSFGQIGSSGCLAWHDPTSGVSWAFLGARTTHSGWLVRQGAGIARSAVAAAQALSDPIA